MLATVAHSHLRYALRDARRRLLTLADGVEPSERRLTKLLGQYDIISFDVFDTLVKRDCLEAREVFLRVAEAYNAAAGRPDSISPEDFCAARVEAGRAAREMARTKLSQEPNLADIYRLLPDRFAHLADKLASCEIQCELEGCFANAPLKRVYDWCVGNGKRVIVVSDMYLSQTVIERMLARCGYSGHERVYVSNEWDATKVSGGLFDAVLEDLSVPSSTVAHVGDDFRGDLLGARKAGIRAIHIARHPRRTSFSGRGRLSPTHRKSYRHMVEAMNDRIDPEWTQYEKYGFECLGPLLLGFARWAEKLAKERGIATLHFMARDGYLLKEAYDLTAGDDSPASSYLYISRKATHIPLLCRYAHAADYLALNGRKRWSTTTASNRLMADPLEHMSEWEALGLGGDRTFRAEDIRDNPPLGEFLDSLMDSARDRSEVARAAALSYFESSGLCSGASLVDTGGIGTTQACLSELLSADGNPVELTGIYLWSYRAESSDYNVYLYDVQGAVGGETLVSEIFMTSDEGTVSGYEGDEGRGAKPVLEAYEYEGHPEMVRAIDEVQRGALRFVKSMGRVLPCALDAEVAYHNVMMVGRHPRTKDVKLLGGLFFHSDKEDTFLAKPKGTLLYYMAQPGNLLSEFKLVRWKVGFLKVLLRIPLPYHSILCHLKRTTDV